VEEGDHLTMLNVYEAFIKVSTATLGDTPHARTHARTHCDELGARSEGSSHTHMAKRLLCFPGS
jgi:hypothetical protein